MELRDYLDSLRRAWLSIVIITLVSLLAAAGVSASLTPKYTATTRLFFGVQGGETGSDLANGSAFTQKQMSSYGEVATSPLVLDKVISALKLPMTSTELASRVETTAPPDTVILEIAATDTNAQLAAQIANSIASNVAAVAGQLSPARQNGSQAVRATILARAVPPAAASSPNVLRNLALGLALGLFVGSAFTLLRRHLDSGVRSEADVRSITARPVLGTIPFDSETSSHRVVMHDDSLSARSEAVRRLRTNLQFVDTAGGARCLVVTSSVPGEGKSTTALNLAVSLADAGQRVLLVDADLRRPSVAEYLGLEGGVGLTTVLIGRAAVADVVQPWQSSSLDILPAGQIPPNPSELLGSKAMSGLLAELAETYDTVLLDSPPLLPVTDAAVLSRLSAGALVVIGVDRIHRPQLRDAMESLDTVGATVLGVVLNKVTKRDASPYSYQSTYAPEMPSGGHQGPGSGVTNGSGASGDKTSTPSNNNSTKTNAPGSEVLVARLRHGKLA